MKTINKTSLLLALIILAIAFSIISMIAAPAEIRYTWHGLNPWNTVQAVPLMFKRFFKMDDWIIYSLSVLIRLPLVENLCTREQIQKIINPLFFHPVHTLGYTFHSYYEETC